MGKAINFILGIILIYLAVDSYFRLYIPDIIMPFLVLGLGVIILIMPLDAGPPGTPRPVFQIIRRFVFGIILIFIGVISLVNPNQIGNYEISLLMTGSLFCSIVLGVIALIYILSAIPRTRTLRISSI